MRVERLVRLGRGLRLGYNRLVVLVHRNHCIVQNHRLVLENFQGEFGFDVEKFPVLTDTKVCQPVYGLVNFLFDNVVLFCLEGSEYLKRQRNGGVVQFLGTDINGRELLPIFTQSSRKLGFVRM